MGTIALLKMPYIAFKNGAKFTPTPGKAGYSTAPTGARVCAAVDGAGGVFCCLGDYSLSDAQHLW